MRHYRDFTESRFASDLREGYDALLYRPMTAAEGAARYRRRIERLRQTASDRRRQLFADAVKIAAKLKSDDCSGLWVREDLQRDLARRKMQLRIAIAEMANEPRIEFPEALLSYREAA